jgi:hypothetical protein
MRARLSYSNVMSTLALFLALAGGTYAATHLKRNSVRSRNIVNGQVKNQDLADGAVNSSKIQDGQIAPSDLAPPEGLRSVGLVSNPSFNCANTPNSWASSRPDANGEVGFYRDPGGTVHLSGEAARCGAPPTGNTIFTLPPGYRPGSVSEHYVTLLGAQTHDFQVDPQGGVTDLDSVDLNIVILNGIDFRCAPSGQNGCP